MADPVLPPDVGHAPELVDAGLDAAGVVEHVVVLLVGEPDPEVAGDLLALHHPQYHVEVGRGDALRLSLLLLALLLEEQRHAVALEEGPAVFPELSDGGEDVAVLVVESHLLVDGGVIGEVRVAAEEAGVGVLDLEGLLGLQVAVVEVDAEPVEVEHVAHLHVQAEVLPLVAPQHHLQRLLARRVDDPQLLGVVPILFVAEDVGAVDDQSDRGKVALLRLLLLPLGLLPQFCDGLQMLRALH